MNLRTEKNQLKKQLDKIEDEHLINAIKELLKYANSANEERVLKPFSVQQLVKRAKVSEKNIKDGKTKSLEAVRKDVINW